MFQNLRVDVLAQLEASHWGMASLLQGMGLRLMECLNLRIKDVIFERARVVVRSGKVGGIG